MELDIGWWLMIETLFLLLFASKNLLTMR